MEKSNIPNCRNKCGLKTKYIIIANDVFRQVYNYCSLKCIIKDNPKFREEVKNKEWFLFKAIENPNKLLKFTKA